MTLQSKNKILVDAIRKAVQLVIEPGGLTDAQRKLVYDHLVNALDETSDTLVESITFVTTHNVFRRLTALINGAADKSDTLRRLSLEYSYRLTARRAYITFKPEHATLRELRALLMAARKSPATPHGVRRAYERFVKQMDSEVLSLSPLEHLAKQGL